MSPWSWFFFCLFDRGRELIGVGVRTSKDILSGWHSFILGLALLAILLTLLPSGVARTAGAVKRRKPSDVYGEQPNNIRRN